MLENKLQNHTISLFNRKHYVTLCNILFASNFQKSIITILLHVGLAKQLFVSVVMKQVKKILMQSNKSVTLQMNCYVVRQDQKQQKNTVADKTMCVTLNEQCQDVTSDC